MLAQESIKLDINVPARMREGTVLYADVYRPDTEEKYPAVLTRLPYDKSVFFAKRPGYFNPQRMARAGYAVVAQDVRGTGASEGEYYPIRFEAEDGYDTVEWIAAQPWCDGNVGMYGFSYMGFTQWAAAMTQPPHLKAICPAQTMPDVRGSICGGGVFRLWRMLMWQLLAAGTNRLLRSKLPPEELAPVAERFFYMWDNLDEGYRFLPLKDVPGLKELGLFRVYSDWLTHIDDDDYWGQFFGLSDYQKITVPCFHLSGWYDDDDMLRGVLNSYKERGGSELARKHHKLLIGPWVHGEDLLSIVGDLNTGMASTGDVVDVTGMHIRWFDYWLKGIDNGIMDEPPVRIFTMGDNVWRDENEWPLARTHYTNYYFHSGGHAHSRSGDGVLSTESPDEEQADIYLYDPRNPVPTKGGVQRHISNEFGVQDQQEVENRSDVLAYTSAPLETDLEVTGPIEIKLWASSSAVDTDFTGKLVDVWPNGKAYNLVDGIVRARYRESVSEAKLIVPGKVYEYSIDLNATSIVFKAGHRIRVDISSSNFPLRDRNLNTGHPVGQDAEIKVAVQTIYHDRPYPSHIVLPVIPR
jgi:putative CocE/NonD family hydrolase